MCKRTFAAIVSGGLILSAFFFGAFQATPAGKAVPKKVVAQSIKTEPVSMVPVHAVGHAQNANVQPKEDPITAFNQWQVKWKRASAAERKDLAVEGEALAQKRQAAMYDLIARDPEAALKARLSMDARRFLPSSVMTWIEKPMNARGDLAVVAATPKRGFEHLISRPIYREARIEGKAYDAYVYGRREKQDTKYGSSLIGMVINDRMAVLDQPAVLLSLVDVPDGAKLEQPAGAEEHPTPTSGSQQKVILAKNGKYYPFCCAAHAAAMAMQVEALESSPGSMVVDSSAGSLAPPPLSTQGALKVLVIVAQFSDFMGRPLGLSATDITTRMGTDVSDFFTQASYGKTSIGTVTTTPLLLLSGTLAGYATAGSGGNAAGLESAALTAATSAGYTVSNYDRVCVLFADTHGISGNKFGWSGLADLGGTFAWFNGDFSLHVVSHELGHNFGMRHANLWKVSGSNPVDPAGVSQEYGDPFDVMGSGPDDVVNQSAFPNPWFLNRVHWLPDSAVQTLTTSGTYRVYRYDHKDANLTNTLALHLSRDTTTDYWVSYRRKYAGGALDDVSQGAYILWGYHDNARSNLIDVDTPGSDAKDASLNLNNTFTDSAAGVSFTVTAQGGSGTNEYIDVQVSFQPRLVFDKKSYSVDEQAGSVTVTVERMNNGNGPVSAHFATANGTASSSSDYTAMSGDLNWADGDMTSRSIVIPITADSTVEGAEAFTLSLSSITGAATPGGSTVTITIQEAGAFDSGFTPPDFTSLVKKLIVQPDGKTVVVGHFDTTGVINSSGVTRLLDTGIHDDDFDQGAGASPFPSDGFTLLASAVARQPDGKILVGGAFTSIRSVTRNYIARLNEDGTLDNSFDPGTGPNKQVKTITVQPDGKILVGGEFTTWNGGARRGLVRLNEDGSVDTTLPNLDSVVDFFSNSEGVNAIVLQPVASAPFFRILVGGDFYRQPATGTLFRSGVVALNATDGSRDTTFDVTNGAHGAGSVTTLMPVSSLAVQPDGKVLVGGQFTGFNGVSCGHFIRLNSDGTNDSSFKTNNGTGLTATQAYLDTNGSYLDVSDILIQNDGKIVVAGHFSTASGNAQPCIARFLANGTFDSAFKPAVGFTSTLFGGYCLALQADGKIVLGLDGAGAGNVMKRIFSAQAQLPSVLNFSSTTATVVEGLSASLVVERSGGSAGAISVNYSTVSRTATAGTDFTTTAGTLSWADGDMAPKTISVSVIDDGQVENDELFEIRLGATVGGVLLGERQMASVLITAGDLSGVPHAEFAASSSSASEAAGTVTLTVNVSPATVTPFTLPISLGGTATAGAGKDYTVGSSSLSFGAGDTSKTISLSILQDSLLEGNETVVLTLGSPSGYAVLGSTTVHTLTIQDDEAVPAIATSPASRMVSVGSNTTFTVVASGSPAPTSYTWKKGTSIILGQTGSSYTINNVQLTNAGVYTATATSPLGTSAPSTNGELAVVDLDAKTQNYYVGNKAILTVPCSANVTGFVWRFNGGSFTDVPGHLVGQGTKTITITNIGTGDHGDYTCTVSSPVTGGSATKGAITVHVITSKPLLVDPIAFPTAVVGGDFHFSIADHINTTDNITPTSYATSVLPAGLKLNTVTGEITGKPKVALIEGTSKNYPITIKAINAKGSDFRTLNLTIQALPVGTVGTFAGMIPRDSSFNDNLGGRITMTIATSGIVSGTVVNGARTYNILSGPLSSVVGSADVPGVITIPRPDKTTPLTLTFTIDSVNNVLKNASISNGSSSLLVNAWRNAKPASGYLGLHTFGIHLQVPNALLPQGTGYGSFTVAANGTLTVKGKLADGVAYTTSTFVGPAGQVLVHQAIAKTDTVLGVLTLSPGVAVDFSDYLLSGSLTWSRAAQTATTRLYRNEFAPVGLAVTGGRYVVPSGSVVFSDLTYTAGVTLSNGTLAFSDADIVASPNVTFLLKQPAGIASILAPNLRATSLKVVPSTGAFSGLFSLLDANPLTPSVNVPRAKVPFQGQVFRDGANLRAEGYFLLNNLPRLAGQTPLNTDTVSGKVVLQKSP